MVAIFGSSQSLNERDADGVGTSHVILVVQSEDDHVVLLDEGQLLFIDGIVFEECGVIQVVIERRFVRNDQILVAAGGVSQGVHRLVERGWQTTGACGWVARPLCVPTVLPRRRGVMALSVLES